MNRGYYSTKLFGERLRECYEIAPDRVQQYLKAESAFVLARIRPTDSVLELGCGYGRVALQLAATAARVVGIDTSGESLALARRDARSSRVEFVEMDALNLAFPDATFDVVVCVQNGICAFGVDQLRLLREAIRVTRPGGRVLFSTYSESFWAHRLEWFERQSERGLIGKLDRAATRNGVIVCEDGFRAGAMTPSDLRRLCDGVGLVPTISEIDGSSLFCELRTSDPSSPSPRLVMAVVAMGAVLALGQALAVGFAARPLWPFSPIGPYSAFPANFEYSSTDLVAVTQQGEVDLVKFGSVRYRLLRRHKAAFRAADTVEQQRAVLEKLFRYARADEPAPNTLRGIKVYRLRWDLEQGEIMERSLLASYFP